MWASAPTNVLHHRRIRRWPAISTAACFAIPLRGNCFRWERCLHAGGAVVQLCRKFIVCWPQRSSRGFFCGLRYNPIRIQRLFLPTFSGKTEKVGLRSNSCGVAAFNSSSGESGQTGRHSRPPLQATVQHHRRRHGCGLTANSALRCQPEKNRFAVLF